MVLRCGSGRVGTRKYCTKAQNQPNSKANFASLTLKFLSKGIEKSKISDKLKNPENFLRKFELFSIPDLIFEFCFNPVSKSEI